MEDGNKCPSFNVKPLVTLIKMMVNFSCHCKIFRPILDLWIFAMWISRTILTFSNFTAIGSLLRSRITETLVSWKIYLINSDYCKYFLIHFSISLNHSQVLYRIKEACISVGHTFSTIWEPSIRIGFHWIQSCSFEPQERQLWFGYRCNSCGKNK